MEEIIKRYAEELCTLSKNLEVTTRVRELCRDSGLYHEEGACVEKIWHITHETKLYEEVGDIFLYKVKNYHIANLAYNKFLYHSNPDFYMKYAQNLAHLDYKNIDTENSDEKLPEEIIDLCDRFDLVGFLMLYLHRNNDFQGVINIMPYLENMKHQILEYEQSHPDTEKSYKAGILDTKRHISKVISETRDNNDINLVAIKIDPSNKKAYFNIIDNFICLKNYDDAIGFYNNTYCPEFNMQKINSAIDVCWAVSDYYRDIYEFYNAVKLQKIAMELEIERDCTDA